MNESDRKEYTPPEILLEIEMETRAGSSLAPQFEEWFEEG